MVKGNLPSLSHLFELMVVVEFVVMMASAKIHGDCVLEGQGVETAGEFGWTVVTWGGGVGAKRIGIVEEVLRVEEGLIGVVDVIVLSCEGV